MKIKSLKKNKKGYLEISFSWIFAFIVGAFILFLAIFAVTKLIKTESTSSDVETSRQIEVLLSPLETSFEEGKLTTLSTSVDSRIFSTCSASGDFGKQTISVNQKVYGKWSDTNTEIEFENKYLFLDKNNEGKIFYLFSKPFDFDFKVASLIYLIPLEKKYCFKGDIPEEISEELEQINPPNVFVEDSDNDCSGNEIQVCFGNPDESCEISVDVFEYAVIKENKRVYYENNNALLYSAIFSSPEFYECQVKRIMLRANSLASLYKDKLFLPSLINCNPELVSELSYFQNVLSNYEDSNDLASVFSSAEELQYKNNARCEAW
ncbi:MAG: hypothetical protein WC812_04665 [Candidatus Pacearchaeota archaeon]|jgi:hypothetical protein